jgi:hypothetical protein
MGEIAKMKDRSREIAKEMVHKWDEFVKATYPRTEPDEVIVARALLRVDAEYGCEVRDPCGTIWDHAARLEKDYAQAVKQIAEAQKDRDEIWSREKNLLESLHKLLDAIDKERAVEPARAGWRVVEAVREMIVDTIEAYQKSFRTMIEGDKK